MNELDWEAFKLTLDRLTSETLHELETIIHDILIERRQKGDRTLD